MKDRGIKKWQPFNSCFSSADVLKEIIYDYVVITIKNPGKAKQIREKLEEFGIDKDKICTYCWNGKE